MRNRAILSVSNLSRTGEMTVKEIGLILACVPLYIVNAFCDKAVSADGDNLSNYRYNWFKFLLCSLCMLPMLLWDDAPKLQWGALLCGAACGIMYAVSKTVMLKGYERTSVSFMTLCHSSGMILPCILGHFLWSEPLSLLACVGILLAIASIVLLKDGKREKKQWRIGDAMLGAVIFLASGGIMIVQKMMGLYFSEQSVTAYNLYSFVVACGILCFLIRPRRGFSIGTKKTVWCAVGSAVSLSVISLVMTALAGKVPSVILFPLFNGLGIIFVCLGSAVVFHEKMTPKKLCGLVIGVVGLCLVNC